MAQLIKLLDYISRYESNPFHYPTQYIRLKQENWQRLTELWETENECENFPFEEEQVHDVKNEKRFFKWNPFHRRKEAHEKENEKEFERSLPRSKEQLTRYFLNELYPFQLKWATSTVSRVSFTDRNHSADPILKHLLQRLPDIYLLMYFPIFNIKKAPIEGEIILVSPIDLEIISFIKASPDATVFADPERTWTVETESETSKIISPTIALKRTEQIIKSILNKSELEVPIKKTVLSQTSPILFTNEPYNTAVIGKEKYDEWLEEKRSLTSPLKSVQLKTIKALLNHCQTISVRRPEWESDDDYLTPATFMGAE